MERARIGTRIQNNCRMTGYNYRIQNIEYLQNAIEELENKYRLQNNYRIIDQYIVTKVD